MIKQSSEGWVTGACRNKRRGAGLKEVLVNQALLIFSVVAAIMFFSTPASAAVAQNLYYDLATDPLTDWTSNGTGIRTDIKLQSSANTLTYRRSDLAIDDKAFQIEAVVSASPLATDGDRGARFWAWFGDTALPPGDILQVEVRFVRAGGANRIDLYDTVSGGMSTSLNLNWTNAVDRLRIRLKRQRISGQDYIILQAEPSSGWDDPSNPNDLSDTNSVAVLLSTFTSGAGSSEVGFGNARPGTYVSTWESVHVTIADNPTTVLPYWPPTTPPAPALAYEDIGQGCLQRVNASADLSGMYLSNDSAASTLGANGTIYTGATRTNPGNEIWSFDSVSCTQAVSGSVTVSDVSGRSRTSSTATLNQGMAQNLFYDLATDPLTDWTQNGAGIRTGTRLQSGGNSITFSRTDLMLDDMAFQVEAVLSAEGLGADGERGARLRVWFGGANLPPGDVFKVEVRLMRSGGGTYFELFDSAGGAQQALLNLDWTNTAARPRVRLKRQKVGGVDYIFLQAEPSTGWDDPAQPNNLTDANSVGVPLSGFAASGGSSGILFGNVVSGVYYSEWESIHITTANDLTTVLPYWPPAPSAPAVLHEDSGAGCVQRVDLSADLSSRYLSNDSAISSLDVYGTLYTGATRTNPGNEVWYFNGINCNQSVSGNVTVSDVSGRSRTSTTTIPAVTRTLTSGTSGTGTGTVTPGAAGASCGAGCNAYTSGTIVGLNISASADSEFTGWSAGSDADCADNSVTMSYDKTCTAVFTLKTYTVATSTTNGAITSTNNPSVVHGLTTTVTGTANANYYFTGVSGCGGTAQSNADQSVTSFSYTTGATTADCTVAASFALIPSPDPCTSDGDLDGDGMTTITDALKTLRIAAGLVTPTACELAQGDVAPLVNGKPAPDGKINIGDVVVILRKAVELVSW